jgi:hypothetical protein
MMSLMQFCSRRDLEDCKEEPEYEAGKNYKKGNKRGFD